MKHTHAGQFWRDYLRNAGSRRFSHASTLARWMESQPAAGCGKPVRMSLRLTAQALGRKRRDLGATLDELVIAGYCTVDHVDAHGARWFLINPSFFWVGGPGARRNAQEAFDAAAADGAKQELPKRQKHLDVAGGPHSDPRLTPPVGNDERNQPDVDGHSRVRQEPLVF